MTMKKKHPRRRSHGTLSHFNLNLKKIMKTIEKIEKKGFKVIANMGWVSGEQTIVSYTAEKSGRKVATASNVTGLFNLIR